MDIISFNEASTANSRIESFIENPDSTSGIVTVPKVIASGETVTIPAGRVAVLPNVQVDGVMNIEGEVFVPSGSTYGDFDTQIALKADTSYVDAQIATRSRLVQGTIQNSTAGTSIDFTGIPSWAKRITVMFYGVSTSGTSNYIIQLGSSAGVETAGYEVCASTIGSTSASSAVYSNGFTIRISSASAIASGKLLLHNITENMWLGDYAIANAANGDSFFGVGSKTLFGGALDRIRITTVTGTNVFDAGQIKIMYEG